MVRLTPAEAAEEIKRLRRFERQASADRKRNEEEITNLKQELAFCQRNREEERIRLMTMYEHDTKKLKGELKVHGTLFPPRSVAGAGDAGTLKAKRPIQLQTQLCYRGLLKCCRNLR